MTRHRKLLVVETLLEQHLEGNYPTDMTNHDLAGDSCCKKVPEVDPNKLQF